MSFIRTKALSEIKAEDIDRFRREGVAEDLDLDFKREPYSKQEYPELRRDVVAFANAEGGDIVVGVREEKTIAKEVMAFENGEGVARQLEQVALCHIWPRVPGLAARHIDMGNGRFVVVIRIPKGLSGPHAYTDPSKDVPEFWKRYSQNQKRPMTVEEIRQAVLEADRVHERTEEYLKGRRDGVRKKYVRGEALLYVYASLVPPTEDAFTSEGKYLQEIASDNSRRELFCNPPDQMLGYWGIEWSGPTRIDAGCERYPEPTLRGCTIGKLAEDRMVQEWHSSGYGCSLHVCPAQEQKSDTNYSLYLGNMIAGHTRNFLAAYLWIARRFGVAGSFVGGLALWNAKSQGLKLPQQKSITQPHINDPLQNHVEFEPRRFTAEDFPDTVAGRLCDRMWHTFGHDRCRWFEDGKFKPYDGPGLAQ